MGAVWRIFIRGIRIISLDPDPYQKMDPKYGSGSNDTDPDPPKPLTFFYTNLNDYL